LELNDKNTIGVINSNINKILIPFSDISSQSIEEFIYLGREKIPFRERHPVFQVLMLNEFVNSSNNLCLS
jgi:hypothetical protein